MYPLGLLSNQAGLCPVKEEIDLGESVVSSAQAVKHYFAFVFHREAPLPLADNKSHLIKARMGRDRARCKTSLLLMWRGY